MRSIAIRRLDDAGVRERRDRLAEFERTFRYPFGDDSFRIDHGPDYLAFFRSLGTPSVLVAERDQEPVGVLVAVRRQVPTDAWYLCDLKVAGWIRHAGTAASLLATFDRELRAGAPTYGISMNPARGSNRIAQIAARCREVDVVVGPDLAVFALGLEPWLEVAQMVESELSPSGWLDHRGRKDLVLDSTGRPMPLLHLQHGPCARPDGSGPRPEHTHMFCLPGRHPLQARLRAAGIAPSATATVLHSALSGARWDLVLTSDI